MRAFSADSWASCSKLLSEISVSDMTDIGYLLMSWCRCVVTNKQNDIKRTQSKYSELKKDIVLKDWWAEFSKEKPVSFFCKPPARPNWYEWVCRPRTREWPTSLMRTLNLSKSLRRVNRMCHEHTQLRGRLQEKAAFESHLFQTFELFKLTLPVLETRPFG